MSNEELVFYLEDLYELLIVGYSELDINDNHLKALEYAVEILEEC